MDYLFACNNFSCIWGWPSLSFSNLYIIYMHWPVRNDPPHLIFNLARTKYSDGLPVLRGVLWKKVFNPDSYLMKVTSHVMDMDFWEPLGDIHKCTSPFTYTHRLSQSLYTKRRGSSQVESMHYHKHFYSSSIALLFFFKRGWSDCLLQGFFFLDDVVRCWCKSCTKL